MASDVRTIQWAMWANESALLGAYVMLIGGAVGIVGGVLKNFLFWLPIGIYGMLLGLVISVLEYPRGKKKKGNTMTRWNQELLSSFVNKLPCMKTFYFRAFVYFLVCLPSILIVPTLLGSVCIIIGSIIYFRAAFDGEVWSPVNQRPQQQEQTATVNLPPSKPPPRLHTQPAHEGPSRPAPLPPSRY